MIVRYEPAARIEVIEAMRWYLDVAGESLANAFEREVDAALRLLMRFPRLGAPSVRASRKLRLNDFPYTLHYRLDGDSIVILAVANQKRKPRYWQVR